MNLRIIIEFYILNRYDFEFYYKAKCSDWLDRSKLRFSLDTIT